MSGSGPSDPSDAAGSQDSSRSSQTGAAVHPILVCVQCGFTYAEFRARGLLGCPSCSDHFGDALFADMLHIHPRLYRRSPKAPNERTDGAAENSVVENAAALREQLSDALRLERYEEAAALRRQLDTLPGPKRRPSVKPSGNADAG